MKFPANSASRVQAQGLGLLRGSASDKLGLVHGASSLDQPLSELTVLIVDCQTTGATPKQGAVLELGWCLARGSDPDWSRAPKRTGLPCRRAKGYRLPCES
ncbi:MAG TPA: hypothetical protein VG937_18385 [Polyangiaceae bacterium]|nr:hypothetical protein [Polyangiaceae bacterium]